MTHDATHDARRYAPAAARNRAVILDTLGPQLPKRGHVLEIASGSGEHITHIAAAFPKLTFQPSEPDPHGRASIDSWTRHLGLTNVAQAIEIDITEEIDHSFAADAVICINMIHITPWSATIGLLRTTASILPPGGLLYLYGPFRRNGAHTAPTNAAFDTDLRAQDPEWGIRNLETVAEHAQSHGFGRPTITPMPANNLSVMFRKH
jgi:hypothetical protein